MQRQLPLIINNGYMCICNNTIVITASKPIETVLDFAFAISCI